MSFTSDVYSAIFRDLYDRKEPLVGIASRLVSLGNGINMVFAVNTGTHLREAYVSLEKKTEKVIFPKWHGSSIDIVHLPAYYEDQYYVRLLQLPQSEDYIFEFVVDDLYRAIKDLTKTEQCLPTVLIILKKWKKFFQSERDLILSDEMQEGLYGELCFLEKSIQRRSSSDVHCWSGGDREPHDFYFATHAVEVKTSSKREPYSAHISSEYQLDSNDVPGRLFLCFFAVQKSKSVGERLPEIIERIRSILAHDLLLKTLFDNKLRLYGYMDEVAEHYVTGFRVRDTYYFEVNEEFPKIVRTKCKTGISKVNYELAIAQCLQFECGEDRVFATIKGVDVDNE